MKDSAQLIGKSSFFVQKWSKHGENGTFERKKGSGRPSKISSKILTTLEKSKYKRQQSTRKLSSMRGSRNCRQGGSRSD